MNNLKSTEIDEFYKKIHEMNTGTKIPNNFKEIKNTLDYKMPTIFKVNNYSFSNNTNCK